MFFCRHAHQSVEEVSGWPGVLFRERYAALRAVMREEGWTDPAAAPADIPPHKSSPDRYAGRWLAVAEERLHVRHLVRLLLLLPSRRQEITTLSWPEVIDLADEKPVVSLDRTTFDGPRLDLPPARMKGR